MNFFRRRTNESAYSGGHKPLMSVIKNTGSSDMIIFKQPEEDFNTNSTLIVQPGEAAIFVNMGKIEQVFTDGTYNLSTDNYPFISRLRNIATGGVSSFHCVVYFVRTADTIELLWGTDSPLSVRDRELNIDTTAKVRAVYKLNVENPSLFLKKLIGSKCSYQSQEDIVNYFKGEFQGKIRSAVASFFSSVTTSLIDVEKYLETWSEQIRPKINDSVRDYGLICTRFTLAGIKIDKKGYDKINDAKIEAIEKGISSHGERAALDTLGTTYEIQQEQDIRKIIANNTTNTNMNVNLPNITYGQTPFVNVNPAMPVQYAPYGYQPSPVQQPSADPISELRKYKAMLDEGLITQEDYDNKKRQLLS